MYHTTNLQQQIHKGNSACWLKFLRLTGFLKTYKFENILKYQIKFYRDHANSRTCAATGVSHTHYVFHSSNCVVVFIFCLNRHKFFQHALVSAYWWTRKAEGTQTAGSPRFAFPGMSSFKHTREVMHQERWVSGHLHFFECSALLSLLEAVFGLNRKCDLLGLLVCPPWLLSSLGCNLATWCWFWILLNSHTSWIHQVPQEHWECCSGGAAGRVSMSPLLKSSFVATCPSKIKWVNVSEHTVEQPVWAHFWAGAKIASTRSQPWIWERELRG